MLGIGRPDRHALPRITSAKLRQTATRAPLPRAGSFIGATLPSARVSAKDRFRNPQRTLIARFVAGAFQGSQLRPVLKDEV